MKRPNSYKVPPFVWLRMTDYTHGWLNKTLAGAIRIHDSLLLSVHHIRGVRDIMRMETCDDILERSTAPVLSMSAACMDMYRDATILNPEAVERMFQVPASEAWLYVPVECPPLALNCNGVLRPWSRVTSLGRPQAQLLCKALMREFWQSVADFACRFAEEHGPDYNTKDMLEEFCAETGTPDMYAQTIRREWLRQQKKFLKES